MKVHLLQRDKLTDGSRGWCGRLFTSDEDKRVMMDWEAVTCKTCLRVYEAFLEAYPNG